MKFFTKCPKCKNRRLYIKQWEITIPHINVKAKGVDVICKPCFKLLSNIK